MGGTLVGGRYRLLEPLAEKEDSALWKAEVPGALGRRPVAIRILRSDDDFARALVEGEALGMDVVHPCLLQPIELFEDGDLVYLVSEWVEGERLSDVLAIHRRLRESLPWLLVASIGIVALRGLDAFASRGLVHGAVSPRNLLLGEHGEVRIAGAGVALTEPHYLAPEITEGEPVTAAADLHALARTLEDALTGASSLPARLTSALERALDEMPNRRFASPREMELQLGAALREESRLPDPRIIAAAVARARAADEVLPEQGRPTLRFGQLERS